VPKATIRSHRLLLQSYANTEWQRSLCFIMHANMKKKKNENVFFLCLCSDVNEDRDREKEGRSHSNLLILPLHHQFWSIRKQHKRRNQIEINIPFFFYIKHMRALLLPVVEVIFIIFHSNYFYNFFCILQPNLLYPIPIRSCCFHPYDLVNVDPALF
jgi:hypothetical protein